MKFENHFSVAAPIEEVWDMLLDVERVAPCMPGAEVLERKGEDSYKVVIHVKLGPVSMRYRGDVEITAKDPEARQAVMNAKATEARGQGTANAKIEMSLAERDGSTEAALATDLRLSGRAAALGQGVVQDVSEKLVDSFADNLAAMLEGAPAEAEAAEAEAAEPEVAEAGAPEAPAPQAAPEPSEPELPALEIATRVAADRLRRPQVLLGVLAVVWFAGYLVGRRGR